MFSIDDKYRIKLTRGDTAYFSVSLEADDGTEYEMGEGDFLTFTVKRDSNGQKPLVQKVSANGTFKIEPKDTRGLSFGDYRYDIQLTKSNGDIDTVIVPAPFILCEEITW